MFFQTALERKQSLADRTHISLDTGMRGHVIVVVSAIFVSLTTDLASEFYKFLVDVPHVPIKPFLRYKCACALYARVTSVRMLRE